MKYTYFPTCENHVLAQGEPIWKTAGTAHCGCHGLFPTRPGGAWWACREGGEEDARKEASG